MSEPRVNYLTENYLLALGFAFKIHRDHARKGQKPPVPYICHPQKVASMVLELHGTEDEAIAALLHDTLEDRPKTVAAMYEADFENEPASKEEWDHRLEGFAQKWPHLTPEQVKGYALFVRQLGPNVADIVAQLTDKKLPDEMKTLKKTAPKAFRHAFRSLHREKLAHIRALPENIRRIKACDALDNLRALWHDYAVGDADVFRFFSGGRATTLWKNQTTADLIYELGPTRIGIEMRELLNRLYKKIEADEGFNPDPRRKRR